MANGHGGKRRPRNPAVVSGPGKMSRRTDGGPQQVQAQMTGMNYGENKDFMDIQSSAPLAATPSVSGVSSQAARPTQQQQQPNPVPLFAPTQRPSEPVTAGAPVGMGPGPVNQVQQVSVTKNLENMLAANPSSSELKDLYAIASRLGW